MAGLSTFTKVDVSKLDMDDEEEPKKDGPA